MGLQVSAPGFCHQCLPIFSPSCSSALFLPLPFSSALPTFLHSFFPSFQLFLPASPSPLAEMPPSPPSPPALQDREPVPAPAAYSAPFTAPSSHHSPLNELESCSSKSPSPPLASTSNVAVGSKPAKVDQSLQSSQTDLRRSVTASEIDVSRDRYPARPTIFSSPGPSATAPRPATPSNADSSHTPQSEASHNNTSILSPSMSQRYQYAGFFHTSPQDSPQALRDTFPHGITPSATPSIADPLQALSMSYSGGFYMPADAEAELDSSKRANQGSLSLSTLHNSPYIVQKSFVPYEHGFPDDSGYNTPYRAGLDTTRSRQGSRALDSDYGDEQEYEGNDEAATYPFQRILPSAIHAPAAKAFLTGFDIDQYDMAKTPSPANISFDNRLNEHIPQYAPCPCLRKFRY